MFDHIVCERERLVKHLYLCQQGRFGKICSFAIIDACSMLKILLDETPNINQLVETCKLYITSDLFNTELGRLAYFNNKVTFPFLIMVKNTSQSYLLITLPKLYTDLTENNIVVKLNGIKIKTPEGDLANHTKRCTKKLQRGSYFSVVEKMDLTHFSPVSHFYTTKGFLTFSGGIEM